MAIFIAPHNDDETLFGAFTILREKPLVVIVYDGYLQHDRGLPVEAFQRRNETRRALEHLGGIPCYLGIPDNDPGVTAGTIRAKFLEALGRFNETVYAPAWEHDGHDQHNLVASAIDDGPNVKRYLTYTRHGGKSTSGRPVPIEAAEWIPKKLAALACYTSQFNLDARMGCFPHFLRDQSEYYV